MTKHEQDELAHLIEFCRSVSKGGKLELPAGDAKRMLNLAEKALRGVRRAESSAGADESLPPRLKCRCDDADFILEGKRCPVHDM